MFLISANKKNMNILTILNLNIPYSEKNILILLVQVNKCFLTYIKNSKIVKILISEFKYKILTLTRSKRYFHYELFLFKTDLEIFSMIMDSPVI